MLEKIFDPAVKSPNVVHFCSGETLDLSGHYENYIADKSALGEDSSLIIDTELAEALIKAVNGQEMMKLIKAECGDSIISFSKNFTSLVRKDSNYEKIFSQLLEHANLHYDTKTRLCGLALKGENTAKLAEMLLDKEFLKGQRTFDGLEDGTIRFATENLLNGVSQNNPIKINKLLKLGAAPNRAIANQNSGLCALHLSAKIGAIDALSALISSKYGDASFDLKDKKTDMTIMHFAAMCTAKNSEFVIERIDKLAKRDKQNNQINSLDHVNRKPIHWAIKSGKLKNLEALITIAVKDEDHPSEEESFALKKYAVMNNAAESLEYLLGISETKKEELEKLTMTATANHNKSALEVLLKSQES